MRYKVLGSTGYSVDLPDIISLDTEYSEKNVRRANLLSISIGATPDMTYILDQFEQVQKFIDHAKIIFTWNGVVDAYILEKSGFKFPRGKMIDAMLLEHLIDERLDHGLGDFALRECNDNYKAEFWGRYDRYQDAPKEEALEYEMKDGVYTYRAGIKYLDQLSNRRPLIEHVHKLQWALFDTEMSGIQVNKPLIEKTKLDMSESISSYLIKLKEEYHEYCQLWELQEWSKQLSKRKSHAGKLKVPRPTFSFASDTQLRWLVYDAMACPILEKTKKGSPKTDSDTLRILAKENPALGTLVEYKDTKALYATFVEGMLGRVEEDNRIYPSFYINGTTTGRISHSNPNMGNLPREGVIRNFFVPDRDNVIVGADYSQLEVVVEANLTDDPQLLRIINEGASKHDITASGLGLSRDSAKTLNFALQYGAGAKKVSSILNIPYQDAQDIFQRYWELYSGVKALKDDTAETIKRQGWVMNLFGRVRHFCPPQNEYDGFKQERQAYNFLIQGVGADMTNMATYRIAEYLKSKGIGRLWFSVHDEIVCEVKKELAEEAKAAIVRLMEEVNDYVKFKYRVSAKSYGPLPYWNKS